MFRLYTAPSRVTTEAKAELEKEGTILRPYEEVSSDLQLLLNWEARSHHQREQKKEDGRQQQDLQQQRPAGLVAAVDSLLSGGDSHLQEPSPKLTRQEAVETQQAAWLDPKINVAIHRIVAESRRLIVKDTPVAVAKVCTSHRLQKPTCSAVQKLTVCTAHQLHRRRDLRNGERHGFLLQI